MTTTGGTSTTSSPMVFKSQLGRFPGMVKIEIDANVQPVITPTRRIPMALKEKFKKEVDRPGPGSNRPSRQTHSMGQ